jgi:hypothetical protein
MSNEKGIMKKCEVFDPNCEGCRPAMMDVKTGQKLPPEHPTMKVVNELWDAAPRTEQEACFRVWVHNSRASADMALAAAFFEKVRTRLNAS